MSTNKENPHLPDLLKDSEKITVETKFGPVTGGRVPNGAAVFLEVPYALPPKRFQDPRALPDDFRYEQKDYIREDTYCAQPGNDGQTASIPREDRLGFGKPSENPLFVNIVSPPSFPAKKPFPVKVYIHGGFLQFGSPHGLSAQAQYVSAERSEVWVNIGYRVSAFGFLASEAPEVKGNFGFKDQWLALLWIKDNIASFGGNPHEVQLTGLSAGAHSVHQILHHVSRLPEGIKSPFKSARLESNGIVLTPKTAAETYPQLQLLCKAVNAQDLGTLSDPAKISSSTITEAIETDALGTEYGTFRGVVDDEWMAATPDTMTWQRSGGFARGLREKGLRSVVVGDTAEEWYLYSIAHPVSSPKDIVPNLERYYPADLVQKILAMYETLPDDATLEQSKRLYGTIFSDFQVHLPVRLLARDLQNAEFPVLRYAIRWAPAKSRPLGYITHGSDRALWCFRTPTMDGEETQVAREWLDRVDSSVKALEAEGKNLRRLDEVLALDTDKTIGWSSDAVWSEKIRLVKVLPGEED